MNRGIRHQQPDLPRRAALPPPTPGLGAGPNARTIAQQGILLDRHRPDIVAIWPQAGPQPGFQTRAVLDLHPNGPEQEIVFIGIRLDRHHIRRLLDSALLTDTEFAAGPPAWRDYPDPLPAWDTAHTH